jgi:hypothetical protein
MDSFKMHFIVELSKEELDILKGGGQVISKLLLIPDDYRLFHYSEGDTIHAETNEGNRISARIANLEIVEDTDRVIVILTLTRTA